MRDDAEVSYVHNSINILVSFRSFAVALAKANVGGWSMCAMMQKFLLSITVAKFLQCRLYAMRLAYLL